MQRTTYICYTPSMNEPSFFRVSIKGIAVDADGRFMLTREDNGMWDMLGGGIDHGEDPIAALRREIQEEAGLTITWISPTPKYLVTAPRRYGHDTYLAQIIYEIRLKDLHITPSEECQELRFFTPDEARQQKLSPTVEKLVDIFDPQLHIK